MTFRSTLFEDHVHPTGLILPRSVGTAELADGIYGTPVAVALVNADGSAATLPRSDHVHAQPTATPQGILGRALVTSAQTGISAEADLTGLSTTVNVASGRCIRVTVKGSPSSGTINDTIRIRIKEGATTFQFADVTLPVAGRQQAVEFSIPLTPSAGAHTYKASQALVAGAGPTCTSNATATNPAFILVEDIGSA